MALIESGLWGRFDKVAVAIARIQQYEPPEGYQLSFSGGKDSVVIHRLAEMAGVKFKAVYNITTVDPPPLVRFVRENYPNVIQHRPRYSMWQLIYNHSAPPTRLSRYCCAELKESTWISSVAITGVRWEESVKRRARKPVEVCWQRPASFFVHPIIEWTTEDVWEFTKLEKLNQCELYQQGWPRIGCIGCPLATPRIREFEFQMFPKYRDSYSRAFLRMLEKRRQKGLSGRWRNLEEVWRWWMNPNVRGVHENQKMLDYE